MFHPHLMLHFSLSKGVWPRLNGPLLRSPVRGWGRQRGLLSLAGPFREEKPLSYEQEQSGVLQCPHDTAKSPSAKDIEGPVNFD